MDIDITLTEKLQSALATDENGNVTVKTILTRLGEQGFGIFLLLFSLPLAIPIPKSGLNIPFGIILVYLAVQMLFAKTHPSLPGWFDNLKISNAAAKKIIKVFTYFFTKIEKISKPRWKFTEIKVIKIIFGIIILFLAILVALPIPLTNTVPAIMILLMSIAICENDGLLSIILAVLGIGVVISYIGLVVLFFFFMTKVGWSWESIKEFTNYFG